MVMKLDRGVPDGEREDPPFVAGLLGEGIRRSSSAVRTAMRSVNQRILLIIWGGGTVAVLILFVIASITDSPGFVGAARGVFGGIFVALLFAVAFGSLMLWARGAPDTTPVPVQRVDALNSQLGPTIRELNALRSDIIQQVKARSWTRVPLGAVGGVGLWVILQRSDDPPGLVGFVLLLLMGAFAGEVWAARKLERHYRRVYKDRVLPQLASGLGDLTYRQASRDRVTRMAAERILPEHDSVQADDEIAGTYDGLPVEIIEVRLKRRQQKKSRVVFDGLLVGVTLPRRLTGTTVVLTDCGAWENFKATWRGALETVRLEHAEFEQRYEVYSTDQIEARALLTPAFMERFMALASTSGFSLPGALADGNRLVVALPKRMGAGDLFEPPAYWKPAGGQALLALQEDIRAVLEMADTVIHLDFWASGRQGDAARARAGAAQLPPV